MAVETARSLLAETARRLAVRGAVRIVMLSDLGFEYGAGGAMRRQIQSLLLDGHDVGVVCAGMMREARVVPAESPDVSALVPRGRMLRGRWLGVQSVPSSACMDPSRPRSCDVSVVQAVAALEPDLVIAGNMHWSGWSISLLDVLVRRGLACVAYMHDLHFLTGRCCQPYTCNSYRLGCDSHCPTATSYPALAPSLIHEEWMLRRRVFLETGVPLIANSAWTKACADEAFGGRAQTSVIRLGIDTALFSPIDRGLARELLGLGTGPMVLFGAVDTAQPEKGGPVVRRVVEMLSREGISFAAFGFGSGAFAGVRGLGYIRDERQMPLVYAASDCYFTASAVESFGQTVLEAAACGRASVTLRRGGIVDIARDGINARTFHDAVPEELAAALRSIVMEPTRGHGLGSAGRKIAAEEYSLDMQAAAWRHWIASHGERAKS